MSDFDSIFDTDEEVGAAVRFHSRFAPSSLARILICPRSVGLAEQLGIKGGRSSVYAAEGTVAHTVAEGWVRWVNGLVLVNETSLIKNPVGAVHTVDGHAITVDQDMHTHGEAFAHYVAGLLHPNDRLYVETTVNMDAALPGANMYGHLDVAIWSPSTSTLTIIDYKYGRGVRVSAMDNAQLKAYAYGALTSIPDIDPDDVKYIECRIYQPRVSGTLTPVDRFPTVDLLMWIAQEVQPTITDIMRDGAVSHPYVTGSHCRWCPAQTACPALRDRALRAAQKAFAGAPAAGLSDAELVQIKDEADIIGPFIEAVDKELLSRVHTSGPIGGWREVPTRPSRVWAQDDRAIAEQLITRGIIEPYEAKLRSPAQIEKILPAEFSISDLLTTKSGGVKLARSKGAGSGATAAEVFSKSPLAKED